MKLQKLTIHNIASIEDAVIDFEKEPLADSEVFLITGETGAGKSTILDAICLALYNNTPRLENTEIKGATQDGEKSVNVNDPRQMMRKNTGAAFVNLTFTGSNEVRYEAEWSVKRAYNKALSNMQKKTWTLKNLDRAITLTKDKEIQVEIHEAIGLDFKQFCRTTLLAQGQFTRFLNSNDSEKAEILEKITGVDIYTKVGVKIYETTKRKEQELQTARQKVEATKILTEEEVKLKTEQKMGLEKRSVETKKLYDEDVKKRDWISNNDKLKAEKDKAVGEYNTAKAVVDSDDFKKKTALVEQWNMTVEARNWMNTRDKERRNIEEQNGKKKTLHAEYNEWLQNQEERKGIYENAQTIATLLDAIQDNKKTIVQNKELEERIGKSLTEKLRPEYDKALKDSELLRSAIEELEKKEKVDEAMVEELKLSSMRKQKELLTEKMLELKTAKQLLVDLTELRKRAEDTRQELQSRQKDIDMLEQKKTEKKPALHDAEVKMNTCKELMEKQKDTVDKFAKTLRQRLKVGDICPVCQQKIEAELPHEEELDRLFMGLEKEAADAEKEYKKLEKEYMELGTQLEINQRNWKKDKEKLDKDDSVTKREERLTEVCNRCELNSKDERLGDMLEQLLTSSDKTVVELSKKIQDGDKKEGDLKLLRKKISAKRSEYKKYEEEIKKKKGLVEEAERKLAGLKGVIMTNEESQRKTEEQVGGYLKGEWPIDWRVNVREFAEMLKTVSAVYNTIKDMQKSIENSERIIGDVQGKLNDFLEEHKAISEEMMSGLKRYTADEIGVVSNAIKRDKDHLLTKETLVKDIQKRQEIHDSQKPEIAEEDTLELLSRRISENEIAREGLARQLGSLEHELKTDQDTKKRLETMIAEVENKKKEFNKWSRLNQLLGDAKGVRFRQIAQSYVLASMIHSANGYMRTLTDRYTLNVAPGTFVIMVEDAYQGYVSRAASTISGGEGFLVSLSLALALSDIGSQLAVDTLFIDEGFGTLSGEPLQHAINTLKSLHSKSGRHVGIISHVEELRERIPVQIQVSQDENSSSSKISVASITSSARR